MSTMERILRLMADKKASDVYLSANSPALIKINGMAMPINNQTKNHKQCSPQVSEGTSLPANLAR